MVNIADRVTMQPVYPFKAIEDAQKEAEARGTELIKIGIGDCDLPTPRRIVEAIIGGTMRKGWHQYPSSKGCDEFITAVRHFYMNRFNVSLEKDEVISLIGAKEGIAHAAGAFVNPGEIVLVPDTAYPVYKDGTIAFSGIPVFMELEEKNDFMPEFNLKDMKVRWGEIVPGENGPQEDGTRGYLSKVLEQKGKTIDDVKVMWGNYPHNPTGACANPKDLVKAVKFCKDNNINFAYDNAYSELTFDGYRAPSILEIDGAKDVAIEFHSLSKTYNMTGDRIGMAVGNPELVNALLKLKSKFDSGQFLPVQYGAIEALTDPSGEIADELKENLEKYAKRREIVRFGFEAAGMDVYKGKGTIYVWAKAPHEWGEECNAEKFAADCLTREGVVMTYGGSFGQMGKDYVRVALTAKPLVLVNAMEKVKKVAKSR